MSPMSYYILRQTTAQVLLSNSTYPLFKYPLFPSPPPSIQPPSSSIGFPIPLRDTITIPSVVFHSIKLRPGKRVRMRLYCQTVIFFPFPLKKILLIISKPPTTH